MQKKDNYSPVKYETDEEELERKTVRKEYSKICSKKRKVNSSPENSNKITEITVKQKDEEKKTRPQSM